MGKSVKLPCLLMLLVIHVNMGCYRCCQSVPVVFGGIQELDVSENQEPGASLVP